MVCIAVRLQHGETLRAGAVGGCKTAKASRRKLKEEKVLCCKEHARMKILRHVASAFLSDW